MKRTNRSQTAPHEHQKTVGQKPSPASDNGRESPLSEPVHQAAVGSGDTGQISTPAGPTIVVRNAEGIDESLESTQKTPEPAAVHMVSEKAQQSTFSRQKSSKPLDAPRPPHSPAEGSFIPSTIAYNLRITFEKSPGLTVPRNLCVLLHKPESYQEIENEAEKQATILFTENIGTENIGTRELIFSYGNCMIVSNNGHKTRRPLRSREDWIEVNKEIVGYWNSHTNEQLRLYISRQYLASQERPTEGKHLAEAKSLEIDDLMKQTCTWEKKEYIPHNVLEQLISDDVIYWIIKANPPTSVPHDAQDAFVHRVQTEGRILLAMCVHAELRIECLKTLLDSGCKDSSLPLDESSQCHKDCRRKFRTLVEKQGGFRAARFLEGDHKSLPSHTVVPLHFCPRAHGKDELDRAVTEARGDDPIDSPNKDACLSTDLDACFALKEFKDKRLSKSFDRELDILKELRKYSHAHIVTHLAAWTQDDRYYMLFPYAQCNMREYMWLYNFEKIDAFWLLDQFRGIAGAVKRIHDLSYVEAPASNLNLMTPAAEERRTAWHHDLKPENILFFRDSFSSRGMFRISDWGSGKVNAYRTRSYHTMSPIGTLTYEPPEYTYDGTTSRPYDLWSLGCVYLELLIWAVFGTEKVKTFGDQRDDKRNANSGTSGGKDDAFWQKDGNEYVLREIVVTQLDDLDTALIQPGKPPFKEVVGYVRRMLGIKTHKRIKALELCDLLDRTSVTKIIEVESPRDGSESVNRFSLIPTDHHSPDAMAHVNSPSARVSGPAYAENYDLSPLDMSPRVSRHSRNSSASELMPSNAPRSRQSLDASNMSNLSVRDRRGSHSSANSLRATEGGT